MNASLRALVAERRDDLEHAVQTRLESLIEPAVSSDHAYVAGMRAALAAAVDYGLAGVEAPGRVPEPVPLQLIAQARLAARNGIALEGILRRYAAGHSLVSDSLLDIAAAAGLGAREMKQVLRAVTARYDRIVAEVSEEYAREAGRPAGGEGRRYGLVRRLLAGELLDTSALGYELDGHHLAIVAAGAKVAQALRELGAGLDRRSLLVCPEEQIAWGWIGGRRSFSPEELDRIVSHPWPGGSVLGCGEPGEGLVGWRLSHNQASAALLVARSGEGGLTRYGDVALLAATLQDQVLATSLRRAYLEPFEGDRDNGMSIKETVRAYLASACNITSAAAALGISRRTVATRLLTAEDLLDRPLTEVVAELEVALRLDLLDRSAAGLETARG